MLNQFILRNYRLFKNETLLDFFPAPINEHKASLLTAGEDGEVFLPVIALYGPNGSGKSSVLEALWNVCRLAAGDSSLVTSSISSYCRLDPACRELPLSFDLLFRKNGFLFSYQLELKQGAIQQENLFYGKPGSDDAGILFGRTESELHIGPAAGNMNFSSLPAGTSLLRYLDPDSSSECAKAAATWFKQIQFFNDCDFKKQPELSGNVEEREVICRLLQDMDVDILDYSITEDPDYGTASLILKHGKKDSEPFFVAFKDESTGIRKLLTLIPLVLKSLRQGSLLLADDLDHVLHPHLLRFVVSLYQNHDTNPNQAQLVFTSHNTALLTPTAMRRDEICLCCRPEGEDAMLYPLSSYKKENGLIPRNDEAYGKQYLEGRYGANPKTAEPASRPSMFPSQLNT